jgi:hypothetical protein
MSRDGLWRLALRRPRPLKTEGIPEMAIAASMGLCGPEAVRLHYGIVTPGAVSAATGERQP